MPALPHSRCSSAPARGRLLCAAALLALLVGAGAPLGAQSSPDTSKAREGLAPPPSRRGMLDWLIFWRDDRPADKKAPEKTTAEKKTADKQLSDKSAAAAQPEAGSRGSATRLADGVSRPPRGGARATPVRLPNPLLEPTATARATPAAEQTDTTFGARLGGPFPNPASEAVRIDYTTGLAPGATLRLYDFLGKTVRTLSLRRGVGQVTIELSGLPPGLYFYSLEVEGKVVATRRLVISR